MKRFLLPALRGALIGVAVQYLVSIAISINLQLGYLMAYIATLAEAVHGEMNAVLLEATLSALLGMGVALAISFGRQKSWRKRRRATAIVIALLGGCLPAVCATMYLLYGLV